MNLLNLTRKSYTCKCMRTHIQSPHRHKHRRGE